MDERTIAYHAQMYKQLRDWLSPSGCGVDAVNEDPYSEDLLPIEPFKSKSVGSLHRAQPEPISDTELALGLLDIISEAVNASTELAKRRRIR